jgi:transposase-like protein
MTGYSPERKATVLKKMLAPGNLSVAELSRQEGISDVTLYTWRKQAMARGEVVSRCRDIVVSPYLLHHIRNHLTVKKGDPISRGRISHGFQTARERTTLQWDHPPTFHEIRSLSGRLYKDQWVDAQALPGHKDSKTTSKYLDGCGIEWISVG